MSKDWLTDLTTLSPSANIREEAGYAADPIFGMSANPVLDPNGGTPGTKKGPHTPDPNAQALADIAKQLYTESSPLRKSLIGKSQAFLDSGMDVTGSPQYQALKTSVDSSFNKAKDNTIARTATGGALTSALAGLEGSRALDMTQGTGQLQDQELARAIGLATGTTPQTISGLGNAANIQSQQMMAQQAQNGAAKQGAGTGLGALLAAFMS